MPFKGGILKRNLPTTIEVLMQVPKLIAVLLFLAGAITLMLQLTGQRVARAACTNLDSNLDRELAAVLSAAGFTGNIQQRFQQRIEANLGRPLNPELADLGRLLWFDKIHSLHHDNTCGGCHSPTNGFG